MAVVPGTLRRAHPFPCMRAHGGRQHLAKLQKFDWSALRGYALKLEMRPVVEREAVDIA